MDNWLNQMWYKLNVKDWTTPEHRSNPQGNPSWFSFSQIGNCSKLYRSLWYKKNPFEWLGCDLQPIEISGESKHAKGKALQMNTLYEHSITVLGSWMGPLQTF